MNAVLRPDISERAIDDVLQEFDRCHRPGVAVGVSIGSSFRYRKGFGLANLEQPIVLTPSTRMRIASVTKHFTCLAYLLLCEEGKARLDDHVGRFLPALSASVRKITVRQLMTHTSGLRDIDDLCHQFSGTDAAVPIDELLRFYDSSECINAEPGTTWSYNNGGYLILGRIIEQIAGETFGSFLARRIFIPLGMHDTAIRGSVHDFVENSATMHMVEKNGCFSRSYLHRENGAEGALVSTVDDLLRWLAHMSAPTIGSADTWRQMFQPAVLRNGTSTGYGLGIMIGDLGGNATIGHSGALLGAVSYMLKIPALGLDAVVLVNRHDVNGAQLVDKIVRACVDGSVAAPEAPARLIEGSYFCAAERRALQLFGRDGRQVACIDGAEITMVPDSNGTLRPTPPAYLRIAITTSPMTTGRAELPEQVELEEFGDKLTFRRIDTAEVDELSTIVGAYEAASIACHMSIAPDGLLRTIGEFGSVTYRLERVGALTWRTRSLDAKPWSGVLVFDDDARGFWFSSLRTRRLRFIRRYKTMP